VTHGIDLSTLSHAEKDALILSLLPLMGQLEAALARVGELEKRLAAFERPAKTPDNSSLPPLKGQKCERPAADKPPRKSRRAIEAQQTFPRRAGFRPVARDALAPAARPRT
jgi:transposase